MSGEAIDAFIAMGSNLGDRHANMMSAIEALRKCEGVQVLSVSSLLETEPIGPTGQGPYLNAAVRLATTLQPLDLMHLLLGIEQQHGRVRSPDLRWGPRTLDLDLIMYGDMVINHPELTVPHPEAHRRVFVLQPLTQIAPDLIHPVFGITITALLQLLLSSKSVECGHVSAGS